MHYPDYADFIQRKMRKGALNDYARQIGCNKVAYAHHMDDIIETMFLSMFYEGQFYSFAPVTYLDRSGITVIRPLMYVCLLYTSPSPRDTR